MQLSRFFTATKTCPSDQHCLKDRLKEVILKILRNRQLLLRKKTTLSNSFWFFLVDSVVKNWVFTIRSHFVQIY